MQIDITRLLTGVIDSLKINDAVIIPNELLVGSRIDSLDNVKFNGNLQIDDSSELVISGNITGVMMLKDDITLEPVEYNFNAEIEENLDKNKNILDITDILWQNILVEIPSKVRATDEDIELSGDGWRVISADKYEEERNNFDNPFKDLYEMLKIKEDK